MVIKVDFDLTMSVLTHNILRIFAMDLIGCSHYTDYTLFNKFLSNTGTIQISDDQIFVKLKKKRNLPALLTAMEFFRNLPIGFLGNRKLIFEGDTIS